MPYGVGLKDERPTSNEKPMAHGTSYDFMCLVIQSGKRTVAAGLQFWQTGPGQAKELMFEMMSDNLKITITESPHWRDFCLAGSYLACILFPTFLYRLTNNILLLTNNLIFFPLILRTTFSLVVKGCFMQKPAGVYQTMAARSPVARPAAAGWLRHHSAP